MKFSKLARYFERLEQTPSRLDMTEVLAELYKEVAVDEMSMVVNLSLGQLRPKYDRLEFNLAEKMAIRALAEAVRKPVDEVKILYKTIGDMGETWEKLVQSSEFEVQSSKLEILEVYEKLVEIAEDGGHGSQERKVTGVSNLLKQLDGLSGKYVARMVVGKLRLGFSDMTVLDAFSWMEAGDKSKRKQLELNYQLWPNVGEIGKLVKEVGADALGDKVEVELGVPVIPALAQRLKTADEMIEKMGTVGIEPKFDGTRVQIHFKRSKAGEESNQSKEGNGMLFDLGEDLPGGEVRTFTRNLDETTHMFPEIQGLAEYVDADELILDSEAMGYNPETGELLPFQQTIKRKRKHGVGQAAEDIPLKFFVFDVLYKDGKSLVGKTYKQRRQILEEITKTGAKIKREKDLVNGLIEIPKVVVTDDANEMRRKHAEYLADGLEGALVKRMDGIYEPGRRGWSWVKFKEAEDSQAKLSDTVDAVVMGLYVGKGKRVGFGVGAFLIGIKGAQGAEDTERFEEGMFYTISKVGTGLTDNEWKELKERSMEYSVDNKPGEYRVDKHLNPDIWMSPGLVVEIAADEVTKSPIHSAGLALRFPRLVKFRDDKSADQVTSIEELGSMSLADL